VSPHRPQSYIHQLYSEKKKEKEPPNPLFELGQEPKQTPKHVSINDLQQQARPEPEPEQELKLTPRQERARAKAAQARAKAAADCTYGEDGQFHLGPVARAFYDRRNPEGFTLHRLVEDDEEARAAGPWEPMDDPLGRVLELLDEKTKRFRAYKAEEAAKEQAVLDARKLERRQKFEEQRDKRNQEGDA
jgi:hypothetical protein